MARLGEFHLTLELDEERVQAVKDAQERFSKAVDEMNDATENMRRTMRDLRDSLKVKREEGTDGPQDPGLD